MNMHYKINLPDNFPKELIDTSKSLENIGVLELAWNKENSIKVIDFLNKNDYLILGGDVYKLIDENTYMVNGNISIGDLEKIIGIEISDGDYETLSGYLLEKLEELPMEGEETIIEDEKLTYKIEEYEDKRIKQVKICKNK